MTTLVPHPKKPALGFILFTLMLDVLGLGLLIPVGPRLVQHLQGGSLEAAAPMVGMLAATYSAMQFLFAPTLGALSDHFGRRPILLIALLGSGLDYFALALSPTLSILFFTRAINGLSGASMTVATAYIADVTPPEKRAGAFGMIGAAFGLGFIIGPLMGGVLGAYDIRYPFYAAGALTLINWLYGYFILPESLVPEHRAEFSLKRANPVGAFYGLGRYPLVAGLAAAMFMFNLAMFGLHATWVLYTDYRYHWSTTDVGVSLAIVGVGAAVVQGGLARKLIPALGEKRSLMLGCGLGVLSYLGYALSTKGWMMYCVIAVGSLGGIAGPALQAIISKAVGPKEQGATQGALTALQSVANIFGPILGASVFAYFLSHPISNSVVEHSRSIVGPGVTAVLVSESPPYLLKGAAFFSSAILAAIGWLIAAAAVIRTRQPRPISE